jgi:hypothetical protein
MRTNLKVQYVKYAFVLTLFILSAFIPAKYAADFKKEKKGIDTLTVFSSIVQVVSDDNITRYIDSTLSDKNQMLLDSITYALLSKKYTLEKVSLSSVDIGNYADLFEQLENSPESLDKISARPLLNNQHLKCKSRYALLLIYNASYHPDFPPHYKLNSVLVYSTIVITPGNPTASDSDLRLLIIDTQTENIVFYDRINASKYDARVIYDLDQMARIILKKIYYK